MAQMTSAMACLMESGIGKIPTGRERLVCAVPGRCCCNYRVQRKRTYMSRPRAGIAANMGLVAWLREGASPHENGWTSVRLFWTIAIGGGAVLTAIIFVLLGLHVIHPHPKH